MNYTYTQEQQMIQDSVATMLAADYGFLQRCQKLSNGEYCSDAVWQQFAQLGLCAMPFDQSYGGMDASAVDMSAIAGPIGEFLVTEPFLPHYLASIFLRSSASVDLKSRFIPAMCSGQSRVVLALDLSCHAGFFSEYNAIRCQQHPNKQWRLSGQMPMVNGLNSADYVIVFAKTKAEKVLAFILDCDRLQRKNFTLIDDSGTAQLLLDGVEASVNDQIDFDASVLTNIHTRAIAFLSAEAVAIMRVLNEKTKRYLQDRQQFGQALSRFQCLQHRMVEMYIQEERARSLSLALNFALSENHPSNDIMVFSQMVKLKINDCAQWVGEQAVQLHGGMGVSDELDIAHYFRRLTCIRHQCGDQTVCLANLVDLL